MVRIKEVPGFYDELHKLETLHVHSYEDDARATEGYRFRYGLDNYERDSPELIALRASLGIFPKTVDDFTKALEDDKARYGIHRERFNAAMQKQGLSQPQLAQWLPFTYYALVMKIRRGTFHIRELLLIENLLGVKEGSLIVPNYFVEKETVK